MDEDKDRVTPSGAGQSRLDSPLESRASTGPERRPIAPPWLVGIYYVGAREGLQVLVPYEPRHSLPTMWTLRPSTVPDSYQDASQFASLPRMLAYASGLASDLPINDPRCNQARQKPSLKMRLLCLASVFGLMGTSISPPANNAASYFNTESPIANAGLLANIGPNGTKSSGAKVCRTTPACYLQ